MTGGDLVVRLPHSRWEIWRTKSGPDPLHRLAEDLRAVFGGRVEEAGRGDDRAVRLTDEHGRIIRAEQAGCLPVPLRARRRCRYGAYR